MPKQNRDYAAEKDLQEPGRHKPICSACGTRMLRIYVRAYDPETENHSRTYIGIGWICPKCERVLRD